MTSHDLDSDELDDGSSPSAPLTINAWTHGPAKTKRCVSCQQEKPLSEFGLDRSKPDKLRVDCKACKGKADARYRQKKSAAYGTAGPLAAILADIPDTQLEALGRLLVELAQSCRNPGGAP